MDKITTKRVIIALSVAAVLGVAAAVLFPGTADAISDRQAIVVDLAPVLTDPDRKITIAGTANPVLGISDPSATNEGNYQRLIITNMDATNYLCAFWLAAGADCTADSTDCDMTAEGTTSGDIILPKVSKGIKVGGDLRTCLVASATPTVAHVSRALVE